MSCVELQLLQLLKNDMKFFMIRDTLHKKKINFTRSSTISPFFDWRENTLRIMFFQKTEVENKDKVQNVDRYKYLLIFFVKSGDKLGNSNQVTLRFFISRENEENCFIEFRIPVIRNWVPRTSFLSSLTY